MSPNGFDGRAWTKAVQVKCPIGWVARFGFVSRHEDGGDCAIANPVLELMSLD